MTTAQTPEPQALVVIDVQEGFDDSGYWGRTANPRAEENIAALVEHWYATGRGPVVLVRHDSLEEGSPLGTGRPGNALQGFLDPAAAALLVVKDVNSAFYGSPDLHGWLRSSGISALVLCGIQTNMCVETTARMAGNLGYQVTFALDATRTFDLGAEVPGLGPVTVTAEELMRATAVNLQAGGFATVRDTAAILSEARG